MYNHLQTFQAGEKKCQVCGDPLPAITCSKKKHIFVCSKEECRRLGYAGKYDMREVGPGEIKCDAPGCPNFIPAGWYSRRRKHYFCSQFCESLFFKTTREPNAVCEYPGCNTPVFRKPWGKTKHRFCCPQHGAAYRSLQVSRRKSGHFGKILNEYFDSFARAHYRPGGRATVRSSLLMFFEFLRSRQIRSLKSVTPRTITAYLASGNGDTSEVLRRQWTLSYISTFMSWLIHQGYLKGPNPVIGTLHHQVRERRLPRPYAEERLDTIWRILEKRGDALAKLAVAIGEEAGLRIGETSNLRLTDVDRKAQRVFVRLPNKTMQERWVPYHDKTRRYLEEWLRERDPSCGHDYLFHNSLGDPMKSSALWWHLRVIFDGFRTKKAANYDEVFKNFKYHRLRHSMTSRLANHGVDVATLMALGGWRSWDGMQSYVKIEPETVQASYEEAMKEVRKRTREGSVSRVFSLEEFGQKREQGTATPGS